MHCEIININGGSFFMDIFTQEFTSSRIMKHICIVLTIQCNVHYTKKQIHEFTILKNIEKNDNPLNWPLQTKMIPKYVPKIQVFGHEDFCLPLAICRLLWTPKMTTGNLLYTSKVALERLFYMSKVALASVYFQSGNR